jgi:homoserine acetyltransferase
MADDYQTYKLGNFKLKSGGEIPDAFIAYKTLGDPSLPAIVYPTWYSGCMYLRRRCRGVYLRPCYSLTCDSDIR